MLFALVFIPQFLVGGLTGILVGNPTIDYHVNNSYFVLGHFHYTLTEAKTEEDHTGQASTQATDASVAVVTMTDDDAFKPASITIAAGTNQRAL